MLVYKNKGSPVENYRPVALQCQFAKVFETYYIRGLKKLNIDQCPTLIQI